MTTENTMHPQLEEVDKILYKAYEEKTIKAIMMPELKEEYKDQLPELKELLEKMSNERTDFLNQMSWKELEQNKILQEFKHRNFESYKKKYQDHFGIEYMEKNLIN
jgi:hypothetical protein